MEVNMDFYMPAHVITGPGCVEKNSHLLKPLGNHALVVTGSRSAVRCGAFADVTAALEKEQIIWDLFDKIQPNPTLSSCAEAGRFASEKGADMIIGIGGGSPLDAAKAISAFAANPDMDETEFYSAKWPNRPLPIVLIGTTAGTGSEVTAAAVLVDSSGQKHSIHDSRLYAVYSFGDPRYTMSLPLDITLSTGMDAVAHCLESALSHKADSASLIFSAEGIRLACPILRAASSGGELTPAQRETIYEASLFGGMAINRTGTVFPHTMSYYLTERYHIPHGFASAVFLPDLLDHADSCAPQYLEALLDKAQVTKDQLLALLDACLPPLTVKATHQEILDAFPRWQNNNSVKNTIGNVSEEDVLRIIEKHLVK